MQTPGQTETMRNPRDFQGLPTRAMELSTKLVGNSER
jgi:hypothetical protein